MESQKNRDIYIKVFVQGLQNGLIAEMGVENWATLCVLASFMDDDGISFPSQELVGKCLGVSERWARERIERLLQVKIQGKPVITRLDYKIKRNYVYRIEKVSQIAIFDREIEALNTGSLVQDTGSLVQDSGSVVQNSGSLVQDTGSIVPTNKTNNKIKNKTENSPSESSTVKPFKDSRDILEYFCKKYRETYSVNYSVSYGRDGANIKNKLIPNYTMEQIKTIIDVTFQEYDRAWATKAFPQPHIGALTTWIPNKALAVIHAKEKKQAEIKKQMEAPTPTAEEIIARLRRGLK